MRRLVPALVFAGLVVSCQAAEPSPPASPPPPIAAGPRIARLEALPPTIRATESAGLAAARIDGRAVLFVADADDRAVLTLDATSLAPLSRIDLASPPRDLMVLDRGVLLATLPEANEVAVLESAGIGGELRIDRRVKTSTEPLAMAVSRDGTRIAVTAGAGHRVDLLASDTLSTEGSSDVPREPRAVIFASNDAVFVTHAAQDAVTTLTGISIPLGIAEGSFDRAGSEPPRRARHAEAFVRVSGEDGREKILVPLVQNAPHNGAPPGGYGGGSEFGSWMMPMSPMFEIDDDAFGNDNVTGRLRRKKPAPPPVPQGPPNRMSAFDVRAIDSLDAKLADTKARDRGPGFTPALLRECLLPRAAVALSSTRMVVACSGDSQAIELDASAAFPRILRRWPTARGPAAIARIDEDNAVVWSPLARSVARFATEGTEGNDAPQRAVATIDLPRTQTIDAKILAGRELFMRNGDPRISKDGLACATCHPDGRDDGLVWQTPKGDRRPRTLAGNTARDTAFGWGAEHTTIRSHVKETMRRLRGTGLPDEDLDAIFAYLASLPPVPLADAPSDPSALRGAQVFASDRAQCATCHEPENGFTDNKAHVFGFGETSVTPSLLGVSKRTRLYHDGRYESFESLLGQQADEWFKPMGGIAKLTPEERGDLAAYLRTL